MEQAPAWPKLSSGAERALDVLVRESALIITCALVGVIWLTNLGVELAADSWLNLLGGKEILHSGLPHHDTLAVMSRGREWIDQQWLANLFYYGVYALGGLGLAARVNILIFVGVLGLVFVAARRREASTLGVMLCCIPMCVVGLEFIRAQVVVEPLFVVLIALLAAESRQRTRRILLAFPMLALWANLHGSVIVAAALVALLGLTEAVRDLRAVPRRARGLLRSAALMIVPWPFVFASPYGLDLIHYYNATLRNPVFPKFLTEWAPPIPLSIWGIPLFLLAGTALFLFARHPGVWTPFETVAMGLTLGGGLLAVRSIPWFTLTAAVLLPSLLDRELRRRATKEKPRGNRVLAIGGVIFAAALLAHGLVRPGNTLATDWPQQGIDRMSQVLREDPRARVLASYDLADWVLFRAPESRGRIAFDGRWEILPPRMFRRIMDFQLQYGTNWESPSRGYRLLVLNPTSFSNLLTTFEHRRGVRILYRSSRVVVLDRGPTADPKP